MIGRQPITFEQIRKSADLRGWYFGLLTARGQHLGGMRAEASAIPNAGQTAMLALFVFAVDAFHQQPDTYRAEAIFDVFMPDMNGPGGQGRGSALGLGGSVQALMELGAVRGELNNLLWKREQGGLLMRARPAAPTRLARTSFRANAFDKYQLQAVPGASAALASFNQVIWDILGAGTSGFHYEAAAGGGQPGRRGIAQMLMSPTAGIAGWGAVRRLRDGGFDVVALLGEEGRTAPI